MMALRIFLHRLHQNPMVCLLLAAVAGCLITFSLAPFDIWPLGIVSAMTLAAVLHKKSARWYFWISLVFGIGLFGMGASWVYISINTFGSTSVTVSLILTSLFVVGLALCFALPFYFYGRWVPQTSTSLLLGFPTIWVLGEWFRSWFLTGFPWLYIGYGHIHTPLSGWAPILGIFGVGFFVVLSSTLLLRCIKGVLLKQFNQPFYVSLSSLIAVWVLGFGLSLISWTEQNGEAISVGMAQGNIPQEKKWDPSFLDETYRIFNGLSEPLWEKDWVVWPEAAIPLFYSVAEEDLASLDAKAKQTNTVFITGILYDDHNKQKYYNSIVALGLGSGITFKTRLVPFGEYVPLDKWLRGSIEFFNLPTSVLHIGPEKPLGLDANGIKISPYICYEVVYPDLVAKRAHNSGVLLTVSNDAWFGQSIGPVQHLQMVQMRALETGRYIIRATNNGISAIVNPRGKITVRGGRATREVIEGEVFASTNDTPFLIMRSWPTVIACFLLLAFVIYCGRAKQSP